MTRNVKANFDDIYALYSPKAYMNNLVKDLNYTLPFQAMDILKQYYQQLLPEQATIHTTIIGSSHGLDAVSLKYDFTAQQMLERWGNDKHFDSVFPISKSGIKVALLDIQPEPLRFACDINLADYAFEVDLHQLYPKTLTQHLREKTDVVSAIGVTSYISTRGLENILETAFVTGKAKIFYFSILNYLDPSTFIQTCNKYGLQVNKIKEIAQRDYKNDGEKNKIKSLLLEKGIFASKDEKKLMTSLFLATKIT